MFSPLAFSNHIKVLKEYPNIKKPVDWAMLSNVRADCLKDLVDQKIKYDQMVGRINDWGNVREAPACGANLFKAYTSHREKPVAHRNKKG